MNISLRKCHIQSCMSNKCIFKYIILNYLELCKYMYKYLILNSCRNFFKNHGIQKSVLFPAKNRF